MKTKCVLIFLFGCNILFGFTTRDSSFIKDSLLAIEYFNIADTSFMNVEKCKRYTLKAIPLLKKTEQWEKYIYCHNALSYCYGVLEEHDSLIANNEFTFQEAKRLLPKDNLFYVASINNLGYAYSKVKQDYRKAEQHFKEALSLFPGEDSVSITAKASIYENLGFIAQREGDFEIAIAYFQEAINLQNTAFEQYIYKYSPNNFKVASNHHNTARVHFNLKQYQRANQHLKTAIEILNRNPDSDKNHYINYFTLLAKSTLLSGDRWLAKSYLEKLKSYAPLTPSQRAKVYEVEGLKAIEAGKPQTAMQHFYAALETTPEDNKADKAELFMKVGEFNAKGAYFEKAEQNIDAAISNLLLEEMDLAALLQSDFEKVRSKALLARALTQKGKLYLQWHEEGHPDLEKLSYALDYFKAATTINDQLRQAYQTEEAKLHLNDVAIPFFEAAIKTALQLFEATQKEGYLADAYFFIEKSKSVLLLEEVKKREANGLGLLPQKEQEKVYQLRTEIQYYEKRIASTEKSDNPDIGEWQSTIFHLREAYRIQQDSLRQLYPDYYTFSDSEPIPLSTIRQTLLGVDQTLLSYFVGEKKVFGIKISKAGLQLLELGQREKLDRLVNEVLDNLKMQNPTEYNVFLSASNGLYEMLLEPFKLLDNADLVIIPSGILGYLPFEILVREAKSSTLPKELPFLIKDHTIKYAYSATILKIQSKNQSRPLKILGVIPVFEGSDRFLSYSQSEAEVLRKYRGKVLLGEKAKVNNFKAQLPQYNTIHFSTHASSNETVSEEPLIYFRDSMLGLSELPSLHLEADMVVLSACETSKGTQRTGEGIMSLARGFTLNGVPSVLTTLWTITEQSAAEISRHFYSGLSKGMTKDEALRRAKLDFLASCEDFKSAPYYWAGFVCVGESSPVIIAEKRTTYFGRGILILAFLIFTGLILHSLKRNSKL